MMEKELRQRADKYADAVYSVLKLAENETEIKAVLSQAYYEGFSDCSDLVSNKLKLMNDLLSSVEVEKPATDEEILQETFRRG